MGVYMKYVHTCTCQGNCRGDILEYAINVFFTRKQTGPYNIFSCFLYGSNKPAVWHDVTKGVWMYLVCRLFCVEYVNSTQFSTLESHFHTLEECKVYLKGELLTANSDLESFTNHLQHRIETLQVCENIHTCLCVCNTVWKMFFV